MNLGCYIKKYAELFPQKRAVVFPHFPFFLKGRGVHYSHLSFRELDSLSDLLALRLKKNGLQEGDKVLLFVRPSLFFSVITFALFKMGAIPVFIDPGMGRKNLLQSIAHIRPKGMIAVPRAYLAKLLFPKVFSSLRLCLTTAPWGLGTILPLKKFLSPPSQAETKELQNLIPVDPPPHQEVAILFTSGGTGIPKGVIYTQKIFENQIQLLQTMFQLTENDIDLPGFPLFSFFTLAMGMTSCLPAMDPTRPALVDPSKIVQMILDQGVTFAAGSPAIWERVAQYCTHHKIKLPSLKYVVMFGAPVRGELHQLFAPILPQGNTFTPYGATEALPVSLISGKEILSYRYGQSLLGRGTCIGRPIAGIEVKIMAITEEVLRDFSQVKELPPFEVGEMIVAGGIVTSHYYEMPEETRKAKIYEGQKIWHRMGDVGYKDPEGNLWFCGRKVHRVQLSQDIYFSIPCEAIFNQHPEVKRAALVGIDHQGKRELGIVIERKDQKIKLKKSHDQQFRQELLELGQKFSHTQTIQKFFLHPSFPVDIRHNIKIDRLKLKEWVERSLR